MPPWHFSILIVQRGTIRYPLVGAPTVGVPIVEVPMPGIPMPGIPIPVRSIIIVLDIPTAPFLQQSLSLCAGRMEGPSVGSPGLPRL
jgi:hypothetical protein